MTDSDGPQYIFDPEPGDDFDVMIALSDFSEGKAMVAMDEDQFDEMSASIWNTAWTILWSSMVTIFIPDDVEDMDIGAWLNSGTKASRSAKRAMMHAVEKDLDEPSVMTAAIKATCDTIVDQIRKSPKV
jgi:PhoPQ-activated pathogenicity-related protein